LGQKIHPIGFRVGVIRDWESKWYLPERTFAAALYEDYKIRRAIKRDELSRHVRSEEKRDFPKLSQAAISHVEIERAGSRIKVTLHTAKPGIIIGRGGKGVDLMKAAMEKMTKKQVHVSVQEIRHPDIDAQLVSESIAQQIEKRIAYKRAMRQAVLRAMKLGVRGIRIMCSGRLAGAEMARKEQDRLGSIPLHTLRADIDYGFAESATTYGNIGIKVWIYKGDVLPGQPRQTGSEPPRSNRGEGRPDRSGERSDTGRGGRGVGGGRGGRGGGGGGRGGPATGRPAGDRPARPAGDRPARPPRAEGGAPEGGGGSSE
jgi:small subunit ribosomal protein S3